MADEEPIDRRTLRGIRVRTTRPPGSGASMRLARSLGSVAISIFVTLVLWVGFLRIFHIDHSVAKNPLDVWRYVFTDHAAGAHRHILLKNLRITLRDAALGYGAGMIGGTLLASIFVLRRSLEQSFMPVALVLRSVPLIAMVPLITLIFGRDVLAVTVIGGIVCFFPTLINVVYGLRSTPKSTTDLMASYGASKVTTLRKVLLPSAVPSFFASARINVPGALIGALLAEWVATGKGSGDEMITVVNTFDYGELWSAVALVTTVSILLYSVVSLAEAGVLNRYVPDSAGGRR
jgi:ABC-type nitrate/sulfonate/bicarbonate transport system permease component